MLLFNCDGLVERFDNRLTKKYAQKGFVEKRIQTDGDEIYYLDNQKREAPILIFVHGFGGDGKISWWQQAKQFCDDYRVIVPDLFWFGQSFSSHDPSLAKQIELLKQIIDGESLRKAHLVGISYGGFVSLGYAKQYPEDLSTLTIVDSPGAAISDEEIEAFCKRVNAENVRDAFIPSTPDEVERLLNFSFYNPLKLTDGIRAGTIGTYFSKYPKEQGELLDELPSNRAWMQDGVVEVPVSILWGEEDQVFLVDDAKQLQEMLNAELTIVKKAGHALPEEKPKAFNEALRLFINEYSN